MLKLRSHFLPRLTNSEVEEYLQSNDLIFVPTGTVEMHGELPLDSETVLSEAFALKMAEKTNALVLPNLPYLYAGATLTGRGTVQLSIKEGIAFLNGIAKSLLRQGFRRQIYLSLHGPAHMTCSPMVRDFFDETKAPILYLDMIMTIVNKAPHILGDLNNFHTITFGAYEILGRLEDIPLTTKKNDFSKVVPQSTAFANDIFGLAYQSGAVGYYFGQQTDHMPTPKVETAQERKEIADKGVKMIEEIVDLMEIEKVVQRLKELDDFNKDVVMPKFGEWL